MDMYITPTLSIWPAPDKAYQNLSNEHRPTRLIRQVLPRAAETARMLGLDVSGVSGDQRILGMKMVSNNGW